MIKVSKFGGSSVANPSQFNKIKAIVSADDTRRIIVTSAIGKDQQSDAKMTDLLYLVYAHLEYGVDFSPIWHTIKERFIALEKALGLDTHVAEALIKIEGQLSKTISRDYLVSRGEFLTAKLLAAYLGFDFVDAADIIKLHYDGHIDNERTEAAVKAVLTKHPRIVVPGFYAATPNQNIRLFSRGGSDISGSILAKMSKADLYENWTDVDGIFVADPTIVKSPKLVEHITYRELRELSYRGANILHEETILPLADLGIPIHIKNTNQPDSLGTKISNQSPESKTLVTGISGEQGFTSFNITKDSAKSLTSVLKDVLDLFITYRIGIEHIPTGIDTFSVISKTQAIKDFYFDLIEAIRKIDGVTDLALEDDIALVAVVGRNMSHIPGVAGKVFTTLGKESINIKMIAQASTELSIIIGISNADYKAAIRAIYHLFYPENSVD